MSHFLCKCTETFIHDKFYLVCDIGQRTAKVAALRETYGRSQCHNNSVERIPMHELSIDLVHSGSIFLSMFLFPYFKHEVLHNTYHIFV